MRIVVWELLLVKLHDLLCSWIQGRWPGVSEEQLFRLEGELAQKSTL